MSKFESLKYLILNDNSITAPPISLSPEHSDQANNQTILNALIMTLVKFGSNGQIEPYLASKIETLNESKTWRFHIRPGFSSEDGEIITADSFRKALAASFKRNLTKADMTEFTLLTGWSDFITGQTSIPEGISAKENVLTFNFDISPQDLLNYLRMPYFGFWSDNNFSEQASVSDKNFSSTGPYKVEKFVSASRLLLKIRSDQPSFNLLAPKTIEIGYCAENETQSGDSPIIIKTFTDRLISKEFNFSVLDGQPNILRGICLNPNSSLFKDPIHRKFFAQRLSSYKEANNSRLQFSNGFFPGSKGLSNLDASEDFPILKNKEKTKIAFQTTPSPAEEITWKDFFSHMFGDHDYEIVPPTGDTNWLRTILHSNEFALRTFSVNTGLSYKLSVIKMMFCSNLGISFPDPSKSIGKLVDEYTLQDKSVDNSFRDNFDKALNNDNVVFPLFRIGDRWLVSSQLDLGTIPKSFVHPLFEKIRLL